MHNESNRQERGRFDPRNQQSRDRDDYGPQEYGAGREFASGREFSDRDRDQDAQRMRRDWDRGQGYDREQGYGARELSPLGQGRNDYYELGSNRGAQGAMGGGTFGEIGARGSNYGRPYGQSESNQGRYGSYSGQGSRGLDQGRFAGEGRLTGSYERGPSGFAGRSFGERGFGSSIPDRSQGRGYGEGQSWENREREEGWFGERDQSSSIGQQMRSMVGKVKRAFKGPKGYKRSDERIREDVCDRLSQLDEIDPSDIEVSVQGGEVTLTGTVPSRHMKYIAEESADEVSGVDDVHNQLRVKREEQQPSAMQTVSTTSPGQTSRSGSRSS